MATEIGTDAQRDARDTEHQPRGASSESQRLADVGKAEAKAMWDDTKASVRSVLNEKQTSTAAELGEFAGALRNAARSINQESTVARIASHTADSLERFSGTLRNKDFDALMQDVQAFARSQPALFLGMAVAAGFLATRFLKSSPPHSEAGTATEAGGMHASSAYAQGSSAEPGTRAKTESPFPNDPRRT